MKLTKQVFVKTIEPYIKRNYGEIVVDRNKVQKLQEVLFATFDNIGCTIEEGVRSEKLVVSSLTKGGIKKYMDIPIVDAPTNNSEVWNTNEVVHQLLLLVSKYGYDVFKDNKRASALVSDVLIKYSNECKVMKVLFREGLSEVLGSIPYRNERELNNALHRVAIFMENLGMSQMVIVNVKTVVKRTFIKHDSFAVGKSIAGHIHASDFDDIVNAEQNFSQNGKQIPEGFNRPGDVYTISKGKNDIVGLYRLATQVLQGSGRFVQTGIKSDYDAIEASQIAFDYLKEHGKTISKEISVAEKDILINYRDLTGVGFTCRLALPTVVAICSAILKKPTLSSLVVLGDVNINGTLNKVDDLASVLQTCRDSGAKKVLLPITSAVDIVNVPVDLIAYFSLIFYSTPQEAVFKALGVA